MEVGAVRKHRNAVQNWAYSTANGANCLSKLSINFADSCNFELARIMVPINVYMQVNESASTEEQLRGTQVMLKLR